MSDRTRRCKEKNQQGKPCSAQHWKGGYCRWHHPENQDAQREASRRGGRASSHTARARKKFANGIRDIADLRATMLDSIEKVRVGELEPNRAAAIAQLARVVVAMTPIADLDGRMVELEKQLLDLQQPA